MNISMHELILARYALGEQERAGVDMQAAIKARGLPPDPADMTDVQRLHYYEDPFWSQVFRAHFDEGLTIDELAERFTMVRGTLYYHFRVLGVKPNRAKASALTDAQKAAVLRALEDGSDSYTVIAAKYGASYDQVRYLADTREGGVA